MVTISKEKLKVAMVNKGYTSGVLAQRSGVMAKRCSLFANRGGAAREDTVYKLAQALGVKPADLIELPPPPAPF